MSEKPFFATDDEWAEAQSRAAAMSDREALQWVLGLYQWRQDLWEDEDLLLLDAINAAFEGVDA